MKSVADNINFIIKHRCLTQVIDQRYYQSVVIEVNDQTFMVVDRLSDSLKTFIILAVGRYIWDRAIEKA